VSDSVYPLMYERPGPLVHWPPFCDLYQRGAPYCSSTPMAALNTPCITPRGRRCLVRRNNETDSGLVAGSAVPTGLGMLLLGNPALKCRATFGRAYGANDRLIRGDIRVVSGKG